MKAKPLSQISLGVAFPALIAHQCFSHRAIHTLICSSTLVPDRLIHADTQTHWKAGIYTHPQAKKMQMDRSIDSNIYKQAPDVKTLKDTLTQKSVCVCTQAHTSNVLC